MLYCTAHARTFPPLWDSPTDSQSLINRLIEHTLLLYISHACGESTANSKRNNYYTVYKPLTIPQIFRIAQDESFFSITKC